MRARPHRRDWEVLGLEPGADLRDVRRAYRERRALYAPDSLATYTLVDDEEREALLARIEDAYQAIVGTPSATAAEVCRGGEPEQIPIGPEPPFEVEPGRHLQHHRRRKTMTLAQVAEEIKVRPSLLEKIEDEQFRHLPAPVYVRGFIVQYARLLGLPDPERVAAAYLAKAESASNRP